MGRHYPRRRDESQIYVSELLKSWTAEHKPKPQRPALYVVGSSKDKDRSEYRRRLIGEPEGKPERKQKKR